MGRTALAGLVAALALVAAAAARADSTPIGPLPHVKPTAVATQRGALVAVALPRQSASSGLVWRIARTVDARVVREVEERDLSQSTVVVFRVVGRGTATIAFALTRGDTSSKALKAIVYRVTAN
jgi:hypothetical protein